MEPQFFFHDLRDKLRNIKEFLDGNIYTIQNVKPSIQALVPFIPQVQHLFMNLIYLLNRLKSKFQNLDPNSLPNMAELTNLTGLLDVFFDSTEELLKEDAETIDDMRAMTAIISGLPAYGEVKDEIVSLIDGIIGRIEELRSGEPQGLSGY